MKVPLYSVRSSSFLFNDGRTFWLVMMTPRWWQDHHHPVGGCQRSWEVTCHHSCHFTLQAVDRGRWPATTPVLLLYRRRIVGCGRLSERCSKTCSLQSMIRIRYVIVRTWHSRVTCASPWGSPDRGTRHMSSWGVQMEFYPDSNACHMSFFGESGWRYFGYQSAPRVIRGRGPYT